MRILITTGIFKPEPGGPATYAAELARRLQSSGHKVAVLTYSQKREYSKDKQFTFPLIRVVRVKNKLLNYVRYFFAVRREIKKYDFVYSLDWFSVGMPVMLAAKFSKKKYILRVGGGYIWEKYLAEGNSPVTLREFYEKRMYKKYLLMYLIIKRVFRNAAHIIFNSDIQRDLYLEPYGITREKTSVIYNPMPEGRFDGLVQSFNFDKRYADKDKEIVFWGRFIKMKNVESLVRAFAKMSDPSFRLLLIGEGPTEGDLRKLAAELDVAHRVEFFSPMSHSDLFRRIVNCYLFVLPSWTDISPNQINEAMSLKIPFLVTKENYLPINNQKFLKIDPKSVEDITEKINQLLDPSVYNAFLDSLHRLQFSFTWNDAVIQHVRLFRKILDEKPL
jgi:glycosyltransferase involved in cell wall biosynthesis